jgi:TolB protein
VGSGDISAMNADGTGRHSLGIDGVDPAWSPDGTRIAFTGGCCAAGSLIFTANADGSGAVDLSGATSTGESDPAWSPDGRMLAFVVATADRTELWVMNADGTDRRKLTNDPQVSDAEPAWH